MVTSKSVITRRLNLSMHGSDRTEVGSGLVDPKLQAPKTPAEWEAKREASAAMLAGLNNGEGPSTTAIQRENQAQTKAKLSAAQDIRARGKEDHIEPLEIERDIIAANNRAEAQKSFKPSPKIIGQAVSDIKDIMRQAVSESAADQSEESKLAFVDETKVAFTRAAVEAEPAVLAIYNTLTEDVSQVLAHGAQNYDLPAEIGVSYDSKGKPFALDPEDAQMKVLIDKDQNIVQIEDGSKELGLKLKFATDGDEYDSPFVISINDSVKDASYTLSSDELNADHGDNDITITYVDENNDFSFNNNGNYIDDEDYDPEIDDDDFSGPTFSHGSDVDELFASSEFTSLKELTKTTEADKSSRPNNKDLATALNQIIFSLNPLLAQNPKNNNGRSLSFDTPDKKKPETILVDKPYIPEQQPAEKVDEMFEWKISDYANKVLDSKEFQAALSTIINRAGYNKSDLAGSGKNTGIYTASASSVLESGDKLMIRVQNPSRPMKSDIAQADMVKIRYYPEGESVKGEESYAKSIGFEIRPNDRAQPIRVINDMESEHVTGRIRDQLQVGDLALKAQKAAQDVLAGKLPE